MGTKGEGVHQSYKEEARNGCDLLFRVKIKGRSMLTESIPLHMSIKIFKNPSEYNMEELEAYIKEHNVHKPDPKDLEFEPIIFTSERTGLDFYMLKVTGTSAEYKKLYDEYDDVGNVYKKFFTHVTIDKDLYDDIKANGLKPEDIEFSNLIMEHGAGNTVRDFEKSEKLQKGPKHIAAALGIASVLASSPVRESNVAHAAIPNKPQVQQASPYSSGRMLNTIASVESQHGKLTQHKPLGGIHHGESAFGKYGLTPNTIRETIHMHPDLKQKHAKAMTLRGDDIRRYMEDNPGLEDAVAQKHLKRLEHHFGQDPGKIGYAWLEGIRGTHKASKEKKDIANHWHVKKIKDAYDKEK